MAKELVIANHIEAEVKSSSSGNTIIPVSATSDNEYLLVPSNRSFISNSVHIKETENHLYLSPFDLMDDEKKEISLKDIISADFLLSVEQRIDDNYKYRLGEKYKNIINELISSSSAYEADEVLGMIVDILENHPYVIKWNKSTSDFDQHRLDPKELIMVIKKLSSANHFDEVIETLVTLSDTEFEELFNQYGTDALNKTYRKIRMEGDLD